jgi:hypothetical protein
MRVWALLGACALGLCAGAITQTQEEAARAAQSLDATAGSVIKSSLGVTHRLGVSPMTRLVGLRRGAGGTMEVVNSGSSGPREGITGRLACVVDLPSAATAAASCKADGTNRVLVVSSTMLNREFIQLVRQWASQSPGGGDAFPGSDTAGVSGVIVALDSVYSAVAVTGATLMAGSTVWNGGGLSLVNESLPVPVVLSSVSQRDELCRAAANPLVKWGAQMRYYMGPPELSPSQCLGQGQCLPLGGQSVWAELGGDMQDVGLRPGQEGWVMLAGRMDTIAAFRGQARGVVSAVPNVLAVLAAAVAVEPHSSRLRYRPVVSLFQGEMAGRVGSRRWVWEARKGIECTSRATSRLSPFGRVGCLSPVTRGDILSAPSLDIEARLRGVISLELPPSASALRGRENQTVYLHQTQSSSLGQLRMRRIVSAVASDMTARGLLLRTGGITTILGSRSVANPTGQDPSTVLLPSPLDSFLEQDVAGAVLSARIALNASIQLSGVDTDASQVTPSFHSASDQLPDSDLDALTDIATLAARTLYAVGLGDETSPAEVLAAAVPVSVRASRTLVQQLWGCLVLDNACSLFQSLTGTDPTVLQALAAARGGGVGDAGTWNVSTPPPLFTNVYNAPLDVGGGAIALQPSWTELLARSVLANATRNGSATPCAASSQCVQALGSPRAECIDGVCARTSAHFHEAVSLAVVFAQSSAVGVNSSWLTDTDPCWSEPYWSGSIRTVVFQLPSPTDQWGLLGGGLVAAAVGGVLLWRWSAVWKNKWKIE